MNENTNETNQWSEEDSAAFIDLAEIFVPGRVEQIATLLHLIPAQPDEDFTLAELACGDGTLAEAILERFPRCHYIALDGSAAMRAHTAQRLARFGERLDIRPFELAEQAWRNALPDSLRCVLSSLSVHHLSDEGKRQLFADMAARLEVGGALLLADIVKPATQHIADLYARQYNDIVRTQSLVIRGDLSGYEQFRQIKWNYFAHEYGTPDTFDQPSLLSNQLVWLREAAFSYVDCFWLCAGHAVYGGYK